MVRSFGIARAALAVVLICGGAMQARAAAVAVIQKQHDENVAAYVAPYHSVIEKLVPDLLHPLAQYAASAHTPECDRKGQGRTFAVLVGATKTDSEPGFDLKGPPNDVSLLSGVLIGKGVSRKRIHMLVGSDATRKDLAETLVDVLEDVGCGDRVVFSISSYSTTPRTIAERSAWRGRNLASDDVREVYFTKEAIKENFENIGNVVLHNNSVPGAPELPRLLADIKRAASDDVAFLLNGAGGSGYQIVLGVDISDFMVAVRNKGADAIAILDTGRAASAAIEERQRKAGDEADWRFEFTGDRDTQEDAPLLVPGHGDFAVFYASQEDGVAPELKLPRNSKDQEIYGLFTFTVASALLEDRLATPRNIAASIQRAYAVEKTVVQPRIEASNPDLLLVAETRPQSAESIRILTPSPKRGAATIPKPQIEIEGLVEWPSPLVRVLVQDGDAALEADGHFRRTVQLKPGLNTIYVHAMTADQVFHTAKLELLFKGDINALEGQGKRYAVIIANQKYPPDTGVPSLKTPIADAAALANLLSTKFGFTTELELRDGRKLPLFLKDPGKNEILFRLEDLSKNAGPKDTVLIYYAGHGDYSSLTAKASWIPADARVGYDSSYLSAGEISDAIKRMQAGNVILISDSCYSGALLRSGPEIDEKIEDKERMRALLKLQDQRSRILITSGNNEPVADLGGDGHSIFSSALLDGLEKMDHDAFSARELFDGYILQRVAANSDQEPQFRPLEKVGHEGGDFVFVRTGGGG